MLWRLDRVLAHLVGPTIASAVREAIETQNLSATTTGLPIIVLIFPHEAVGKECQPKSKRASTNDNENGEQGVHDFFRRSSPMRHARASVE